MNTLPSVKPNKKPNQKLDRKSNKELVAIVTTAPLYRQDQQLITAALVLFFVLTAALLSIPTKAEEIQLPIGSQGDAQTLTPAKSITKNSVISQFGEPQQRFAAIGEPPITRWEYATFYVFFEYDRVIHSVLKK